MTYVALVIIVFIVTFVFAIVAFYKFFASIFRKIGKVFTKTIGKVSEHESTSSHVNDPQLKDLKGHLKEAFGENFELVELPQNFSKKTINSDTLKDDDKVFKVTFSLSDNIVESIKSDLQTFIDYVLGSDFFRRNLKKILYKVEDLNAEIYEEYYPSKPQNEAEISTTKEADILDKEQID